MKPGDVLLVRFPFTDLSTTKKRPALLLSRVERTPRSRLSTVAMITSQVDGLALEGDIRLTEWEAAGLLHPSLLRLAKIASIDEELVDRAIGRLAPSDISAAAGAFRRMFRTWLK